MSISISKPLGPIPQTDEDPDAEPVLGPHVDPSVYQMEGSDSGAQPFPIHCLPGVMAEMASEMARVTTAQSLELAAASILATCSAALGAGVRLSSGGERYVRPNIYLVGIAESGTGKGENFGIACKPLEELESVEILNFEMNVRPGLEAKLTVAKERLKKQTRNAAKAEEGPESDMETQQCELIQDQINKIQSQLSASPKIRVSDVTKEALAIRIQGQPGEALASLSSEARGIVAIVAGKYSKEGGDEDIYCSAYSGDSITVDRVGRASVRLKNPCLVVFWLIQPDAAANAFGNQSFTDSGLLPRCLIFDSKVEPKSREEPPDPIPGEMKQEWHELIGVFCKSYRSQGDNPMLVEASPAAIQVLHDYENENIERRRKSGDLRDLAPYVARWAENAWRIALILHCASNPENASSTPLEASTASNAVEIMRWFADQQLEVLQASRRERLKGRLLSLLAVLADAKGEMTMRDLRRSHSFEEEEVKQLYRFFPHQIIIEKHKPKTGRPSFVVTSTSSPMTS